MHCLARFFKKLDHKLDPFPQNQQNQKNYDLKLESCPHYSDQNHSVKYIHLYELCYNYYWKWIPQSTFFDRLKDCSKVTSQCYDQYVAIVKQKVSLINWMKTRISFREWVGNFILRVQLSANHKLMAY